MSEKNETQLPTSSGPTPRAGSPSSTPETDEAWESFYRKSAGLSWVRRKMAVLEQERNEARDQLHRIAKEGFGMEDTIGGESCVDYVLRRLGKSPENSAECPECEGTGKRSFVECDDLVPCVDCNGTGIIRENVKCPPTGATEKEVEK